MAIEDDGARQELGALRPGTVTAEDETEPVLELHAQRQSWGAVPLRVAVLVAGQPPLLMS